MGQTVNALAYRLGCSRIWPFFSSFSNNLYYFDFWFYIIRVFFYVNMLVLLRYSRVFWSFGISISAVSMGTKLDQAGALSFRVYVYDLEFDYFFDHLVFFINRIRLSGRKKRLQRSWRSLGVWRKQKRDVMRARARALW